MTEFVANMLLEWHSVQPPLVERVLWVDYTSRQLMTIEIEHRRKKQHRNKYQSLLPVRRDMDGLDAAIMDEQLRIGDRDPYACLFKPDEEFDPDTLKLRDHAYQLIAPLVEQHYEELFCSRRGLQPHRFRYWLMAGADEQREERIAEGCQVYAQAAARARRGEYTISLDELTGVQALERKAPDLPMQAGHVLRREFEYIRYGTLSWFINFDVVTGQVIKPSWGPTRDSGGCAGPHPTPDCQ